MTSVYGMQQLHSFPLPVDRCGDVSFSAFCIPANESPFPCRQPMESQRQYLLLDADFVDKKSSEWFSVDGHGNRGTVRPEMPRRPQQGSIDKEHGHAGTPKFYQDQHEQTIRRTLQFCGLLISLAFTVYVFIPWGSPYLSWLGTDSPFILYAQEILHSLPSLHVFDDALLDDPIPMPNVSCKLHGWFIRA